MTQSRSRPVRGTDPESPASPLPGLRTTETLARDDVTAGRTAALVRAAFSQGDRFPGLPAADGVTEAAEGVLAELALGARLWTTVDEKAEPLGCVRAIPVDGDTWVVRRLAVLPSGRGRSVGRHLMRALEASARAAGMRRVALEAVVERGNPAFYCRLGYRTTAHFPSPDKPLSEVRMTKDLAIPDAALPYPWGGEPVPLWAGGVRAWFSGPAGTAGIAAQLGADPGAALEALADRAVSLVGGPACFAGADAMAASAEVFLPGPPASVPSFLMPRLTCPDALALWRMTS
jgi:GNAT superfamily N-acetyltransferase